jgi:two-component system nitrogen regulation response regulator NtrX
MRKLEENQWNVSLTASQIGLERSHLHRKMKALAIVESEDSSAGS